jgi:hypothetical protein
MAPEAVLGCCQPHSVEWHSSQSDAGHEPNRPLIHECHKRHGENNVSLLLCSSQRVFLSRGDEGLHTCAREGGSGGSYQAVVSLASMRS